MPDIDARNIKVALPDGWSLAEETETTQAWQHQAGPAFTINVVDIEPLDKLLRDVNAMRQHCRDIAATADAGIVVAEYMEISGCSGFYMIQKKRDRLAWIYTAMAFLPVADGMLMFVFVAKEGGTTGVRDTTVTLELMARGQLEIERFEKKTPDGRSGRVKGWLHDPYDSGYEGLITHSLADHEEWDEVLPNDPLSRARRFMRDLPRIVILPSAVS